MLSFIRKKWRRVTKGLKSKNNTGPCILVYHRVAELPSDPQLLCVTPQNFAEHLSILKEYYHPLPLLQLLRLQQEGNTPDRAVAITFDDGYADSLHSAKPLLEQFDIRATVFVTTGYLGQMREFWWDELERILLGSREIPDMLRLRINDKEFRWALSDFSSSEGMGASKWNVHLRKDPSKRHQVYRVLCQLLRPLLEEERQRILEQLRVWAGISMEGRDTHRALQPEELITLAEGDLIEVGGHTVNHALLSAISESQQLAEIQECKRTLEEILGQPVSGFSYPYGNRSDYSHVTAMMVQKNGFVYACANFPGLLSSQTDFWQLPRFLMRDCNGEEFHKTFSCWMD